MSKHKELLEEAREHLDRAAEHVDADLPRSARRRIALAQGCIERAIGTLNEEPTGQMGAQTSDGQSPRSASEQMAHRLFGPGRAR